MSALPGQRRQPRFLQIITSFASRMRSVWRAVKYLIRVLALFFFGLFLIFLTPFAIGNFVLSTPKVQTYRNLHPALPMCKEGLENGWTILADANSNATALSEHPDENDWVDLSNDENAAIAKKGKPWSTLLRCALQRHVIPSKSGKKQIDYYLAFLEFKESGEPYALAWHGENGDESISTEKMKDLLPENYLDMKKSEQEDALLITQLDVLKHHLMSSRSNYVIVFAHGWRHDASLGDGNVADLRHYAAHAARFLAQRCETEGKYCGTTVTAVYIGWRGARVNEAALKRYFGQSIGGFLGSFAAGATLFDRKPVSEQVAPGAISALRALEKVLWPDTSSADNPKPDAPINKMIVFGHSLGGNLFATGLQDDLVKSVRRHKPGEPLPSILGNLVVLINPAAEAAKWTTIQREVWSRIAYNTDSATDENVVCESHKFFPSVQKPVIVSVTAALTFPSGGLRDGDCEWLNLNVNDYATVGRQHIKEAMKQHIGMFREGVDHDWATHDLFPVFKFDFRPLALWADREVARSEGRLSPEKICAGNEGDFFSRLKSEPLRTMKTIPLRLLSKVARNFPFQNTNQEHSHTIGNLDPLRPAGDVLVNKKVVPAAPFGTTHELFGFKRSETPNSYASLADAPIDCPPANSWLSRARADQYPHGTNWDTATVRECVRRATERVEQCPPAAQFLHGFNLAGQQPITRANDPFWNMRTLDALSRHDGYRLSSFICAMNQLVMDDITGVPSLPAVIAPAASEPCAVKSDAAEPNAAPKSNFAASKSPESATAMRGRRKSNAQKAPSTRAPTLSAPNPSP